MNREKKLVKNTIILTIGKICTQLITFFLLPLYTAMLSTEEYGTVDLLNTLVSLLLPIITFQLEQAIFRKLIELREKENKDKIVVISTSIITITIQCILYSTIFSIISPLIHNNYKFFLLSNVIVFIYAALFQQIARGADKNIQYAISSIISAFFTILFNVILLLRGFGANGMLLGTFLGQIACIIYLFFALKIYDFFNIKKFNFTILKEMWKYSIPLIPNAISWWIFTASDRIIVSYFLGIGENGILSAAHKFSNVYITVFTIFSMSWTESIAVHIDDSDIVEYFNNIFDKSIKIFIALAILIISCMPIVYPIMINNNYFSGYYQVPIMMISGIFNVIAGLTGGVYVAKKNTKSIASTSIISASINIVVHLLLIKYVGLFAATISTLISYFILIIYRIYDINKRYFVIKIDKNILVEVIAIVFLLLLIYYVNNIYLNVLGIIISLTYSILINRESINSIKNIILNKLKVN